MRKFILFFAVLVGTAASADKFLVCDFEVPGKDTNYSRVSLNLAECLKSGAQKEFKSGSVSVTVRCAGKNSSVSFKSNRASTQRAFSVSKNSSGSVLEQSNFQLKGVGKIASSCKIEAKAAGNYYNQSQCQ